MVFLELPTSLCFLEIVPTQIVFVPFLKLNFQSLRVTVRQMFSSRTSLKLQECRMPLKDVEAVCRPSAWLVASTIWAE